MTGTERGAEPTGLALEILGWKHVASLALGSIEELLRCIKAVRLQPVTYSIPDGTLPEVVAIATPVRPDPDLARHMSDAILMLHNHSKQLMKRSAYICAAAAQRLSERLCLCDASLQTDAEHAVASAASDCNNDGAAGDRTRSVAEVECCLLLHALSAGIRCQTALIHAIADRVNLTAHVDELEAYVGLLAADPYMDADAVAEYASACGWEGGVYDIDKDG